MPPPLGIMKPPSNTSSVTFGTQTTAASPLTAPADPPIGFTDSDFAGDSADRKSTSGYVFTLCGGAISWRARKQPLVAFSTVEAEYIGASDAVKESVWIRNLYADLALNKRQTYLISSPAGTVRPPLLMDSDQT